MKAFLAARPEGPSGISALCVTQETMQARDWQGFLDHVRTALARALLLDYDGTLAPFSADRDRAFPYAGVREALAALLDSRRTRVAVVSGRPARDVERLLGLDPLPEIWGSHGLEHRGSDGACEKSPAAPGAEREIEEVCSWVAGHGWERLLERKPFGLALHARGAPPGEFSRARDAVVGRWRASLEAAGLEALEFDGGIEWRPSGSHKGDVVSAVLSQMGPGAAVAYLGDDRTDEDAFRALSGRGLSVLVRGEPRRTAADIRIRPPEELLEFLLEWEAASRKRS